MTRGRLGARAKQAYDTPVRTQLGDLQRARILSAAYQVCGDRGAGNVSVAHIVSRSGVSRRTFYEQFSDREDCLLAAFEQALSLAAECVIPAYEAEKGWRERIRASLVALLAFLDEEPDVGKMLVVGSLAAGPRVLARREETVRPVTRMVDEGRAEAKGHSVSALTAEGVVGGALAVIQARLTQRGKAPLLDLASPLMNMIVLPYLGSAAARRELERPAPELSGVATPGGTPMVAVPFKELGMRLTYRTVRALLAIAEHPRASNRQVGESAGIADQGQISKLLGRLERIGLIENTGIHPGKGAPNIWALTDKGRILAESVRAHTTRACERGEGS